MGSNPGYLLKSKLLFFSIRNFCLKSEIDCPQRSKNLDSKRKCPKIKEKKKAGNHQSFSTLIHISVQSTTHMCVKQS